MMFTKLYKMLIDLFQLYWPFIKNVHNTSDKYLINIFKIL